MEGVRAMGLKRPMCVRATVLVRPCRQRCRDQIEPIFETRGFLPSQRNTPFCGAYIKRRLMAVRRGGSTRTGRIGPIRCNERIIVRPNGDFEDVQKALSGGYC